MTLLAPASSKRATLDTRFMKHGSICLAVRVRKGDWEVFPCCVNMHCSTTEDHHYECHVCPQRGTEDHLGLHRVEFDLPLCLDRIRGLGVLDQSLPTQTMRPHIPSLRPYIYIYINRYIDIVLVW